MREEQNKAKAVISKETALVLIKMGEIWSFFCFDVHVLYVFKGDYGMILFGSSPIICHRRWCHLWHSMILRSYEIVCV
jgi:hypothetical protein